MDPTNTENKTALKRLMGWLFPPDHRIMVLGATLDFDSEKVLVQCHIGDVFLFARRLEVYDECARLAIDLAKVVAHLKPDPRVQQAIDAAELCFNSPTVENRDAAWAAWADVSDMVWGPDTDTREAHFAGRTAMAAPLAVLAVLRRVLGYEAANACESVAYAAEAHPELIQKIDTIEARFRTAVYNALMAEIERLT